MKSEPDGLGGRRTPGRKKRREAGDGREEKTLGLMSGTLGRPDEGIEDGAVGSRREDGRDFLGRTREYREGGAVARRFLLGDRPSASCGFLLAWLTNNEETLCFPGFFEEEAASACGRLEKTNGAC